MTARIFVQTAYDKYDKWGIHIIENVLEKKGYKINYKFEDYDIDIIASKNGKMYFYEVEVKIGYPFDSRETFPFDSVSFLSRKKKYEEKHGGFYYCIVCKETECIAICHSKEIYKEEYRKNDNVATDLRSGEDEFYRVPKEKCIFYDTKNDKYI